MQSKKCALGAEKFGIPGLAAGGHQHARGLYGTVILAAAAEKHVIQTSNTNHQQPAEQRGGRESTP